MDILILIASLLYLVAFLLGVAKGFGKNFVSDQLRHRCINIAFLWHTLLLILPAWQFGNYFYVVEPYERIVIGWAMVGIYLLWTKKFNLLIIENFIICGAFLFMFPLLMTAKLEPESISLLWLQGGGLLKHFLTVFALGMLINTVTLDISNPPAPKLDKTLYHSYLITLILWLLSTGLTFFWLKRLKLIARADVGEVSIVWFFAIALFLAADLYYRRLQVLKPQRNGGKILKLLALFILVSAFAVVFGL